MLSSAHAQRKHDLPPTMQSEDRLFCRVDGHRHQDSLCATIPFPSRMAQTSSKLSGVSVGRAGWSGPKRPATSITLIGAEDQSRRLPRNRSGPLRPSEPSQNRRSGLGSLEIAPLVGNRFLESQNGSPSPVSSPKRVESTERDRLPLTRPSRNQTGFSCVDL